MRIRLTYRLTMYVTVVLVLGFAALVYYDMKSNTNAVLLKEIGTNEAERLADAVFKQLYNSMYLGGGAEENRKIMESFRRLDALESIRLVRSPAFVGPSSPSGAAGAEDTDPFVTSALAGEQMRQVMVSEEGRSFARFATPLVADERCIGCHEVAPGEVLGVIDVKVALTEYGHIIWHRTRDFVIWAAVLLMVTFASVLLTVRHRVLKPLGGLKRATEAIASGDFNHRVELVTGDEVEDVARAFNKMALALEDMTTRFEDLDEKHSRLVDMAPDAIFLRDPERGRFVDANPSAEVLTGYSRDELLTMEARRLFPEERLPEYGEVFKRWLHDGKGYLHDASVKRKDGSEVYVEIGAALIEHYGKVFVQEIWRDLSERKGFEKTIKRYVEELEDTVRERTAKLNSSLLELEEAYTRLQNSEQRLVQSAKLISLGEMGAGIAHELNSPLAGILGLTEVLLSRTDPGNRNHFLLEKIKDAAVRSKYIILDVLTYSRPTKGERAPMFVNETIKATLCMFISEIKTSSIEIAEDLDPELPKVLGNKGQLMEVMLNLVKNARDAMEGEGRIFISTRTATRDGRDYAEVEIKDTGPGVDPKVIDKIFDPFFSTKEKGGGANIGLGLSISQSIVKEHGGTIEVESAPGEGAAFRVYLPVAVEEAAA